MKKFVINLLTGLIITIATTIVAIVTLIIVTILVLLYSYFLSVVPYLAVLIGIIIYVAAVNKYL